MAEIRAARDPLARRGPEDPELTGMLKPSRILAWGRALGIVCWALWVTLLNLRSALSGRGLSSAATMGWHAGVCRLAGIETRVSGEPVLDRPVLMVSNHVSYLDIVLLGALLPCSFVAKADVAGWPVFGWLARQQRTIFVERDRRRAKTQLQVMKDRLSEGGCVILFPEGTSSDGSRVLPFKSSLLQAAEINLPESGPVDVQTVSIAYSRLDGMPMGRALRPYFAWYGDMELAPHLIELLGLGTLGVDIVFHAPIRLDQDGGRKQLASVTQAACAAGVRSALRGDPTPAALLSAPNDLPNDLPDKSPAGPAVEAGPGLR